MSKIRNFELRDDETAFCYIRPAKKRSDRLIFDCYKQDPDDIRKSVPIGKFGEIHDLDAKNLSLSLSVGSAEPLVVFTVASGKGCRVFKDGSYRGIADLARCKYDV